MKLVVLTGITRIGWCDPHRNCSPVWTEPTCTKPLADRTIWHVDSTISAGSTVRFRVLGGMNFVCLFECKSRKSPIKRSDLQVLLTKVHAVGAHKGVVVSRSGFQTWSN